MNLGGRSADGHFVNDRHRVLPAGFDVQSIWPWYCWLDLTDEGGQLAQEIQSQPPNDLGHWPVRLTALMNATWRLSLRRAPPLLSHL
jgi:hypothetical protein